MKVYANVMGQRIEIPVGPGNQHVRWLALVAAVRYAREFFPHAFMLPLRVSKDAEVLKPRALISDCVEDGGDVVVELRTELPARAQAEAPREPGALEGEEDDPLAWFEGAYGPTSNLMDCQFPYIVDDPSQIPVKVAGHYYVHRDWEKIFPQATFGGPFEMPLEAIERPDGGYSFVASKKFPPGTARFYFLMEDGSPTVSKLLTQGTITGNGENARHNLEFTWDVPIAPSPVADHDSRPSTASSADGAQADPRFEQDWSAMPLTWIDHRIRMRIKDVLVEFYAILIDLFDSYAFMGLDLSTSSHTIGLDDVKHLFTQCELLAGQKHGILWSEVCGWYLACSEGQDVRPYLPQRIPRHVYLELLLRAANTTHCGPGKAKEAGGQPPRLDEGFFRFITEVLIPVMDKYDEDPIRKDAVEHDNLIAIQQKRPSLRSIYSFLSLPWSFDGDEPLVSVATLEFLVGLVAERTKAGAEAEDVEEWPVTSPEADAIASHLADAIDKVTQKRPEPQDEIAVYFWEFFEIFMLLAKSHPSPLHIAVPKVVDSWVLAMRVMEDEALTLPGAVELEAEEPPEPPAEEAAEKK
jgi:hypothetical protein